MAWDSSRPVAWKRLGMWLGLYVAFMLVVTVLTSSDDRRGSLFGILIGVVIAGSILVILTKFGWKMPMLMSREELAETRATRLAARQAARAARKGTPTETAVEGPRVRPAPTRRTTTGSSQHPRRTNKTRRR